MNINSKGLAKEFLNSGLLKTKIGDFASALNCFKHAVELDSNLADAHKNKGFAEMKQATDPFDYNDHHGYNNAIGDFNNAIELDPDDAESYFGRGLALAWGFDNLEEAIEDISKAIRINPRLDDAYHARGDIKALFADIKVSKLEFQVAYDLKNDALADYNEAIKLNPDYPGAYISRAAMNEDNGNYSEAILDYDKAISLDRLSSVAYYKRGLLRKKLGDKIGAKDDLNNAIKIEPENQNFIDEKNKEDYNFIFEDFSLIFEKKDIFTYIYFLPYYPVKYSVEPIYSNIRSFVNDFKEGKNSNEVAIKIAEDFLRFRIDSWWLCIIPASTGKVTEKRFKEFCTVFSNNAGTSWEKIHNGYSLIKNLQSKRQLNNDYIKRGVSALENIEISNVNGKRILLFDVMYTTGSSFVKIAKMLKAHGALEVIGVYLAKTHWTMGGKKF